MMMKRRLLWMPVLLILIAALTLVNLLIGTIDIEAGEIVSILLGNNASYIIILSGSRACHKPSRHSSQAQDCR